MSCTGSPQAAFTGFVMRKGVIDLAVMAVIGAGPSRVVNSVANRTCNPPIGAFGMKDAAG